MFRARYTLLLVRIGLIDLSKTGAGSLFYFLGYLRINSSTITPVQGSRKV